MCSRVLRCDTDIYGMASMYIYTRNGVSGAARLFDSCRARECSVRTPGVSICTRRSE